MEEKSELYAGEAFAEEGGEGEEVVIMCPDEILFGREDFRDAIGEELVGGEIGEPEATIEAKACERCRREGEKVVEKRPKIVFAEAVVESLVEIRGEEDRDAVEFLGEALGDGILVGGIDIGAESADVDDVNGGG